MAEAGCGIYTRQGGGAVDKVLGPRGIKAFERRGISIETAVRYGIYTGSHDGQKVVPDLTGAVICFPFFESGGVVNEKYRAKGKKFWQWTNPRRTFWNADALQDPTLASADNPNGKPLIITEGEIDALTAIDCGFPHTVSVPDGAPPPPKAPVDSEGPEHDGAKFEFLFNNQAKLRTIRKFVIAADNDAPGKHLQSELIRRLSASRCYTITYPDDCKDLNDVLVKHGPAAVKAVINGAKPHPVSGVYEIKDYQDCGPIPTYSTGWPLLDHHLKLFAGEFMVVTGVPGHGKSTWVLNLLVNMARRHGWRSAIFSPEMPVMPWLRNKLRRIITNSPDDQSTRADPFIQNSFVFIDPMPVALEEDNIDLDWVIDKATEAILRWGIRILVIDPWNEIEHARGRNENLTDYIGRSIRALKKFAQSYAVVVIVIAHPTKDGGNQEGACGLYDIEGSAHWFNKPDHGVVIERPDDEPQISNIYIRKVRFQETGAPGLVRMHFDQFTNRFEPLAPYGES